MKIEYTIINRVASRTGTLRFKLLFDEDDFILINQFEDKHFRYSYIVEDSLIGKCSGVEVDHDKFQGNKALIISWDKDKLSEIKENGKVVGWEARECEIELRFVARPGPAGEIIEGFKNGISGTMGKIKKQVPKNDNSCYKKVESLIY